MLRTQISVVTGLLLACCGRGHAQLPSASTPALGMADNYTAQARGYSAVAWNPALLGLPDNPRISLAVLPLRGIAGLDPITLGDISDYDGEFLPLHVRERWLMQIESEGSEQGTAGGDLTLFAVQYGRFGAQLSSALRAVSNIAPGAAELILFGNYGRASVPRPLDLAGSYLSVFAASTFAISYGMPIGTQLPGSRMTVGATVKYTIGHVLLHGEDRGTTFTEAPAATINFPIATTRGDGYAGNGGAGLGIDLGLAIVRGKWTFGGAVQNLINTFQWDEDDLVFRAGMASFDVDTHTSDFDDRDFAGAPSYLKEFVEDARFTLQIAAGMSYGATSQLTITGDFRTRLGGSTLAFVPATHLGAGAEYRALPMVLLRSGVAYVEGGYQIAGGVGVDFGPVSVAASVARRDTELGIDTITMFTLISTTSR
jgi:hypothetical protein